MFTGFADLIVYQLLALEPDNHFSESLHFFIMDVSKIFFMLVVVIYVMGLFRSFLSAEKVRHYVKGKSKLLARLLAIILGAVTPFCSCSSVPLFIGFVEAGIPLGVTFSFLIASPMINEIAVVMLLGIVGWKITALYVLSGLVVAFFGGILIEKFRPERWVEDYVWKIQMGQAPQLPQDNSLASQHRYAQSEVKEIVTRIWKWVLIGVAAGALFHGYFPQQWAENLADKDNFLAVPMAVIFGVPLYSNAVGVIPLAEAMLIKGVAIGTTLAFMMSIAAISLPELLILRKVIKWQALLLFTVILTISIICVGWFFNLIL
ncbi:MAG: permease [gamma proteobacterium symbiont of Bathyaustriella thionipta]|nr:permease [gamma proteobacterium symbiont of Bathyaustriella thionipta]MCU7949430.1 permease [gamma proteobacterium symbiont of Bathyaustriella thionipta]MCU7954032.1 permease [gamma proteobacterium symbiont of Bathyaustriella thionipta]MCU7956017.1 permease [gamma proteobacterium symbiont of Bathyaustriella thionipta]